MSNQIRHIGIAMNLMGSRHAELWQGIRQFALQQANWKLHWLIPFFTKLSNFDGLLVEVFDSPNLVHLFRRAHRPMVILSSEEIPYPVAQVLPDHYGDGQVVAEHLLSCGLKNFAFCGYQNYPFSKLRQQGFQETLARADRSCAAHNLNMISLERTEKHPRLTAWLSGLPRPVGIMGVTDLLARRIINIGEELGLRVPQEWVLAGVDNHTFLCDHFSPHLTSLPHDKKRIGYEAASLLNDIMAGRKTSSKPVRIPPLPIVVRESSNMLAITDPDVIRAVEWIHANANRPICCTEMLTQVSLSRRTLEMRFRRLLGRTIHEEIRRSHLERAKALLSQTPWSAVRVAEASGFSAPDQLSRVFKKHTGFTPGEYRRKFQLGV